MQEQGVDKGRAQEVESVKNVDPSLGLIVFMVCLIIGVIVCLIEY